MCLKENEFLETEHIKSKTFNIIRGRSQEKELFGDMKYTNSNTIDKIKSHVNSGTLTFTNV